MGARVRLLAIALAMLALLLPAPPVGAASGTAERVDLDVLFVGAHPDDEAGGLAVYGQWDEYAGLRTGVITVTRGEGGGNAVGLEEGPALGLLREAEERRAVGRAGIEHVYNLDKVDFYYTVSAPLTEGAWGREDTLERVVRVIRSVRPETVVTMNPSPTPGNHGHHQYAARLAVEAFAAAADPLRFPEQLTEEGLQPFRAGKLFRFGATGTGANGPDCAATFVPAEPTEDVASVFSGRPSARYGTTWAAVERTAQRDYASQGWSVFPDVSTDPAQLPCDRMTLIDSRVPFTRGNTDPLAAVEGASVPAAGGYPLGTEFFLTADAFRTTADGTLEVIAHARAAAGASLDGAVVTLDLPAGWTATGEGLLGPAAAGGERTATFGVSPDPGAPAGRVRLGATLAQPGATATTGRAVEVVPPVAAAVEPLPQVAQYREWVAETGVEQIDNLITPRLALPAGGSRPVRIDVTNNASTAQDATVALGLPAGFATAEPTLAVPVLAPGATTSVTFTVTADPGLPTGRAGGDDGEHPFTVTTTTTQGATAVQGAAFNVVPSTTIPAVPAAPAVDGAAGPGEYPGPMLDVSGLWEGSPVDGPADGSGTARVTRSGDDLYVLVDVTDDVLGTVLPPADAKRHWRTDSVELTFDPRGDSENTSTTFKVGIFPLTDDPAAGNPPVAYRDADAYQGPVAVTAPGVQVASQVRAPYTGYAIEARIPLASLPAAADPERFRMNVLVYDSDTQDRTGQTRLGWSTFGGVQGDPYRWGYAALEDYTPPADRPTVPGAPILPTEQARSVTSPQALLQASEDGVALAGARPVPERDRVRVLAGPRVREHRLTVALWAGSRGTLHLFAWDGERVVAERVVELSRRGPRRVVLPLAAGDAQSLAGGTLLVGFEDEDGRLQALAAPVRQ